jgi:hypothetical protein
MRFEDRRCDATRLRYLPPGRSTSVRHWSIVDLRRERARTVPQSIGSTSYTRLLCIAVSIARTFLERHSGQHQGGSQHLTPGDASCFQRSDTYTRLFLDDPHSPIRIELIVLKLYLKGLLHLEFKPRDLSRTASVALPSAHIPESRATLP